MDDGVLQAARAALVDAGATQYALRKAGIGSETARRILAGQHPVRSDQLSKALDAYGLTLVAKTKPRSRP